MKVITHEAEVTELGGRGYEVKHVYHLDSDLRRHTAFYGPMLQQHAEVLVSALASPAQSIPAAPCQCKPNETTGWTDDDIMVPRCNVCGLVVMKVIAERKAARVPAAIDEEETQEAKIKCPTKISDLKNFRDVVLLVYLEEKKEGSITIFLAWGAPVCDEGFLKDFAEADYELFDRGPGEYLLYASWQPEQRSFPEPVQPDFPAYWEYEILDFEALPPHENESSADELPF